MGEQAEFWRAVRKRHQERRRALGVQCPRCIELTPKRIPAILLPGQKCRVDGYRDPRPTTTWTDPTP